MDLLNLVLWILFYIGVIIFIIDYFPRLLPNYRLAKSLPNPGLTHVWTAVRFLYSLTPEKCHTVPREWAKEFGQTYGVWAFGRFSLQVINASVMQTILCSTKHTHKGAVYHIIKPFLGEGLLISNDKKWLQRRRILTPAFHFHILQQFLPIFREERHKLCHQLQIAAENNEAVNLAPTMSKFTLNTVCETSMGVKLDSFTEADAYRRNIYNIGEKILERHLKPWLQVQAIYKWSRNRFQMDALLEPVHRFTRNVIKVHREATVHNKNGGSTELNRNDDHGKATYSTTADDNIYAKKKQRFAMLDTLLEAEARGLIDPEGIREEVDTFMFEGHDTTSCALIFICLLLSHHPDVQERVYEEIKAIVEANEGKPLGMASYNQMDYTERVIKECLRLYPPVPFISRVLTEDIHIETGQLIPKGTECHLHIFDLHRDPEQFPNPDKFEPDRFLPEEVQKRHPFSLLIFSAGPRNCIAQKFAMLEIKSCLEEILMHFQILPVTKCEDVVIIGDIVLRSQSPIQVKMVKRGLISPEQ